MAPPRILILGASGRLGTMLRLSPEARGLHQIWQFRSSPSEKVHFGESIVFDPMDGAPRMAPVDMVLCLSGIVPGKGPMSLNSELALAAVECARALQAKHILLPSSAAVYGPAKITLTEQLKPYPQTAYGKAKLDMENQALARAEHHGLKATVLRIGNVAGADALLDQNKPWRMLDRFDSGTGPVRSYIGPRAFGLILYALIRHSCSGTPLPTRLNLALRGGVAMAELCDAAQLDKRWQDAPSNAIESVVLDVTCLAKLVDVPIADAKAIVTDWQVYRDTLIRERQGKT